MWKNEGIPKVDLASRSFKARCSYITNSLCALSPFVRSRELLIWFVSDFRSKVSHYIASYGWLTLETDSTNKDRVSLNSSWFLLPPQKENWKRYIVSRSYMETGKFCIIFRRVCTFRLVCIFKPEEMFASGKEMGKGCGAVHSISDFLFLQVCYLRKIFGVKNSR